MNIAYIVLFYGENFIKINSKAVGVINNLFIVDNLPSRTNNFNDSLKAKIKHCIYIKNKENVGYSGGMNVGLKRAEEENFDWYILMNDDVVCTEKGLASFEKQLQTLPPGIYGIETGVLDKKRWTTILNNVKNCDYVSGSFVAIHSDVYKQTKGFNEEYFMYYEDVELSIRAKKLGYPVHLLSVEGIHHTNSTKKEMSNLKDYYLARNHLHFVFQHAPLSVKIHEIARLPKTLYEHYKNKRPYAIRGVIDALKGKTGKEQDVAVEA